MSEKRANIIVITGASSSGKTTLAKILPTVFDEPCLHLSVDRQIWFFYLKNFWRGPGWLRKRLEAGQVLHELYDTAVQAAKDNKIAIVDVVLAKEATLQIAAEHLAPHNAIFVGLRCSLDTLNAREKGRRNRRNGLAQQQHNRLAFQNIYDIELDSSVLRPAECAVQIKAFVDAGTTPTAFAKLQRQFADVDIDER
jgi:chloramphenicol 3-O phosphotransferase